MIHDFEESQLTPWFQQPKKPARAGLYLVRRSFTQRELFLLWDGYVWRYPESLTLTSLAPTSLAPGDKWRGLLRNYEGSSVEIGRAWRLTHASIDTHGRVSLGGEHG